jgi:hypothetical protein
MRLRWNIVTGQSSKKSVYDLGTFGSTFSRMGGAKLDPSVLVARPHRLDHAGIWLDVSHVVLMAYASLYPS